MHNYNYVAGPHLSTNFAHFWEKTFRPATISIFISISVSTSISIYLYLYLYIYIILYLYLYMHICKYVYIYIYYTYIHMYTHFIDVPFARHFIFLWVGFEPQGHYQLDIDIILGFGHCGIIFHCELCQWYPFLFTCGHRQGIPQIMVPVWYHHAGSWPSGCGAWVRRWARGHLSSLESTPHSPTASFRSDYESHESQ